MSHPASDNLRELFGHRPFLLYFCARGLSALLGAMPAAALGGITTVAVALLWMRLFPTLRDVDRRE